jgi:tetratricopeptide (TPR) repeat protein
MIRLRVLGIPVALAAALLVGDPAATATSASDRAAEARALYGQARYAEARLLLEALAAEGAASGPLLYRLAYCRRVGGEAAGAEEAERLAREALESEFGSSRDLETPFYLVNAYQNQKRDDDARRVAAEAVERMEQGDLAPPTSGDGWFQLGKLYADTGRDDRAAESYVHAVEALGAPQPIPGSYLLRASRFLAERAFRLRDFSAAARHFTTLAAGGEMNSLDWERLGVARARVGRYADAVTAWKEAEAGAVDANRPRYSAGIARQVASLEGVPAGPPGGKPWTDHTQAELEAAMQEHAQAARAVLAEVAAAERIGREERAAYRARLRGPRELLLGAALEYAMRGLGIREASFFGGYAPLLIKPRAWRVPQKPEPQTGPSTPEAP